jgi:hypothetical protein
MRVHFVTPAIISRLDISSMGDSSKRGDESTLGQFDSGLKYAIALLLRNNVGMSIKTYDDDGLLNVYTFSTNVKKCPNTSKEKELIDINYIDYSDDTSGVIETGFALQMGYNWSLWMALRELYSNMLDEKGSICEEQDEFIIARGTIITLEFDEDNEFYNVWQNRHLYINEKEPLFKVSSSVECLENKEGYLRIYKNNILVYEDKEKPSRFAWNIHFGDIDERRILSNLYSIEQSIASAIQNTTNEDFLKGIIAPYFQTEEKEFLSANCGYSDWISDTVKKVVNEVYEEFGEVRSYDWLIDKVRKQKDCKIGGKKIKTIEDSLWNYSTEVTIETTPQPLSEPSIIVDEVEYITPFASEIKQYYNFELDVEVKIAKLKGSKVIADKYEKCLIIDENFDIEKDFHTFVVEYLDLIQQGNVVENLAKYICNLIKK